MKPATAATPVAPSPSTGAAPAAHEALDARDLALVLALVRGGTLAEAGRRLGLDTSSVFRAVKRLEKKLGRPLFERARAGMVPGEAALALAEHAEAAEAALEAARDHLRGDSAAPAGTLRVTSIDLVQDSLLLPLVGPFLQAHPGVQLELLASNQPARLDRREADVALRGTRQPPGHLVGVRLGTVRSALWAHRRYLDTLPPGTPVEAMAWATPDADAQLADYPSRRWRLARYPDLQPRLRCDGMLAVTRAIEAGVAVGVAPYFRLQGRAEFVDLSGPLPEVDVDLWLLTHPDMRHLRRVKAFFDFVRERVTLP